MHSNTPLDSEEVREPMTEALFNFVTQRMHLGDRIAAAARLVLVEGKSQKEACESEGVKASHLSETIANIGRKWDKLAAQHNLVYVGVALDRSQIQGVLEQEKFNLRVARPPKKTKSAAAQDGAEPEEI